MSSNAFNSINSINSINPNKKCKYNHTFNSVENTQCHLHPQNKPEIIDVSQVSATTFQQTIHKLN
jgi:hypothetical protein